MLSVVGLKSTGETMCESDHWEMGAGQVMKFLLLLCTVPTSESRAGVDF